MEFGDALALRDFVRSSAFHGLETHITRVDQEAEGDLSTRSRDPLMITTSHALWVRVEGLPDARVRSVRAQLARPPIKELEERADAWKSGRMPHGPDGQGSRPSD